MRIDFHFRPHVVVVEPQGRLTVETEAHLTGTIRRLHEAGFVRLVLSLKYVPVMDSCGLGAVAQAYASTWSRGGALKIAEVSPRNHRLFEVTGLAGVFEVFGTRAEALRSFGPNESVADGSESDEQPGRAIEVSLSGQEALL